MSASNCLRCLVRPSAVALVPRQILQAGGGSLTFTATAATKGGSTANQGGRNSPANRPMKLRFRKVKKKGVASHTGKPPLPGERKAYRKKIVLSNNNALPVPGLEDLRPADLSKQDNVGTIKALPEDVVDALRAMEAFKPTQCWGIFRRPAMLIRQETVDLTKKMKAAEQDRKVIRVVVEGNRITGKSLMLLQAMTHALMNDWVVLHIPEAQELTTAVTEYASIENSPLWTQPTYTLKLLHAFKRANEKVLSRMNTVYSHADLPQIIPINSPLMQLINSAKEADGAWAVFQALWRELNAENAGRPPILFSLDGLAHIMKVSDYRNPAFELIHSHDLALVKLFTDILSGAQVMPNGGAVLAATTRGNSPRSASMELAIAQREAEKAGPETVVPQRDPYSKKYDDRTEAVMKSVEVLRLKGLSKSEARGLLEYWAASGVLKQRVDENLVSEKWTLSGNGVVGEMERASLLTMKA
ncbi:mitochondrial ribosomal death-associated protein 3-domain-containing protein [Pseudoneurospora amorphoporcata]|uniref:Small ribosomal subunit protein mS29 n=1 Tax=Pseudoneurospora amorphoporcata TaxID=241081 RepID=A0AAN6NR99_9PEZI|nr:mitochondrial ribosomal death-associated protein 3-domain-containing protein [Pseudoneurospora amorphoporcata]